MRAIMHAAEELLHGFGRHQQKHEALGEHQPADHGHDHRQRAARPDIVAEDHRQARGEADDGVDQHHRRIGHRGLNRRAAAYEQAQHKEDSEEADEAREENRKPGHANLRCGE